MPEPQPIETESIGETAARPSNFTRIQAFLIDLLQTILVCLVAFVVINIATARIRVENISMQPTLVAGEFVLVNRLEYRLGQPATGDIIVFYFPGNRAERYIKRVIGTPGDRVRIQGGQVFVNDQLLNEPYIAEPPAYEVDCRVPPNTLFVLGDNRNHSSDSHNWGFLPMSDIVGKSVMIYWPPGEARLLE